jgi:hypothetical protein
LRRLPVKWIHKVNKEGLADIFDKYVPDGVHPSPVGCREIILPDIHEALGIR